ncbi:hypothetical protein TRICI_004033 [Trichomonascus ciferrii]|uniref:Transferase n=1 Tax=Trichomonascus ciferrii TaxID=44093 RepID=A0A642V253_9ASCO|nr:hypothetical protein TRICI_004033 [Trichomonascus ciferrii]
MTTVEVIERYDLQCEDEGKVAELEDPYKLGALDALNFPFVPVENVFVYEHPTKGDLLPVERLHRALSYVLNYYPHLTGRLHYSESYNPELVRLGSGGELIVAKCNSRLEDLRSSKNDRLVVTDLPSSGADLTPLFDPTMEGLCRDPILTVQHTRFACGGVALGVRINHMAGDACSLFKFCRDLAEIYRNISSEVTLSGPPVIRPYLQDTNGLTKEELASALQYNPPDVYLDETPPTAVPDRGPDEGVPVIGRILRFTSDQLTKIKQQAMEPQGTGWVSTFEALSAYLTQKVYQARVELLESEGKTPSERLGSQIWTVMNVRAPDRLNLPPNYFGNASYPLRTKIPHELFAHGPLWQVANSIHTMIRRVDPPTIKQTLDWVAVQPDISRIKMDLDLVEGNITLMQWSHFKPYTGMNFDGDTNNTPIHPILSSPPSTITTQIDGMAIFTSTEQELTTNEYPPSIDILLSLSKPLWDTNALKHIVNNP